MVSDFRIQFQFQKSADDYGRPKLSQGAARNAVQLQLPDNQAW
jgi:hypothetical protein